MQLVHLDDVLLTHHLEPAEGPGTTGVIELCLSLPAATTSALIRIDFQKAFLTVFDHPPDAHRGFDVPAALLTFLHASPEHQVSIPLPLPHVLVPGSATSISTTVWGFLAP